MINADTQSAGRVTASICLDVPVHHLAKRERRASVERPAVRLAATPRELPRWHGVASLPISDQNGWNVSSGNMGWQRPTRSALTFCICWTNSSNVIELRGMLSPNGANRTRSPGLAQGYDIKALHRASEIGVTSDRLPPDGPAADEPKPRFASERCGPSRTGPLRSPDKCGSSGFVLAAVQITCSPDGH